MIIIELIIKDIIKDDIFNTFKIAKVSTLFYQILKPILDDEDSLLSEKLNIVNICISHWNLKMANAACHGHKDLVKFFIEKGANDWENAIYWAANGVSKQNKDIVLLMIEKGANNWFSGIVGAASGDHKDLYEFFQQKIDEERST